MRVDKAVLTMSLLVFAMPAWAYLDPGSVSIYLQSLAAAIAAAGATFNLWWGKVKSIFRGDKKKQNADISER